MKGKNLIFITVLFFTFLLWTMDCGLWAANAEVPRLINYQGRLTDTEGQPIEGLHTITFRIYNVETNGSVLWEEEHKDIDIEGGIISIMMGSLTALNLPFDEQYYLEIKVDDEVMSPRQTLTSSAYSLNSQQAESLPDNVILICKGSCPAGYKRIAALDGKFLAGGSSYNSVAGGSNTHTHSAGTYKGPSHSHKVTGDTSVVVDATIGVRYKGGPDGAHHHSVDIESQSGGTGTVTGTSGSADNRPEFATVVLCEKE